jgi:ferredoxin
MAEKTQKLEQNVTGKYYVDATCVDCDLCRNTAPNTFHRDEDIGLSVVFQQPSTPDELMIAEEARIGCPTESIGNDGD